jgi:hypothetical protein
VRRALRDLFEVIEIAELEPPPPPKGRIRRTRLRVVA